MLRLEFSFLFTFSRVYGKVSSVGVVTVVSFVMKFKILFDGAWCSFMRENLHGGGFLICDKLRVLLPLML